MARSLAVQLAPNVYRIPTFGRSGINSFAFVDADGSVTLVDCGLASAPKKLVHGLIEIGKRPQDVTRIILTHVHSDHVGGAHAMSLVTEAPVAVHAADAEYATAGRPPAADSSLLGGRLVNRLPGRKFPPVEVGQRLADREVLDVGGGLRVVHTPGHSPGHVSLLHLPTRVLITGDALFNVLGIRWPPKSLCSDFRMTKRTAHVLGELDYDVVAFTHGPEIKDGAREKVRRFLSKLNAQ
jgi:glyoxylase-like metal-dependent hydrolase (beta-lactamase superfamily II)